MLSQKDRERKEQDPRERERRFFLVLIREERKTEKQTEKFTTSLSSSSSLLALASSSLNRQTRRNEEISFFTRVSCLLTRLLLSTVHTPHPHSPCKQNIDTMQKEIDLEKLIDKLTCMHLEVYTVKNP